MRTGYIYILHFDEKLAHASHYVGCTFELCGRLTQHANGRGSRLTRELCKKGINWRLGSLFSVTTIIGLRRAERQIKDQKNAGRYCGICQAGMPSRFPGTLPYPVESIPFGTTSMALRVPGLLDITTRFTDETEPWLTMTDVVRLMQADKDRLGFIPVGGDFGMMRDVRRGNMVIAQYEGTSHTVGYLYYSQSVGEVHIHQTVVADALRGCGVGRKLVETLAARFPEKPLCARVRDDLPANEFWQTMGFFKMGTEKHKTSQSTINLYTRPALVEIAQGESRLPD